ncbi:hypothetical protein GWK47_030018 [Chionoecetes opilio]|uniref:Uncharacterized protein n=1 Tax=Chionoecetes opilio TaxID=41210 RepID=A0A8J4YLV1_CHIOP|nr:hypothetical protein GWK47_030018 [Chionoecetes opilio]
MPFGKRGTLSESTIRSVEEFSAAFTHQLRTKLTSTSVIPHVSKGHQRPRKASAKSKIFLNKHIKRGTPPGSVWFQADVPTPEIESPFGKWMVRGCYKGGLHPHVSVDDPLPKTSSQTKSAASAKIVQLPRCSCRAKKFDDRLHVPVKRSVSQPIQCGN